MSPDAILMWTRPKYSARSMASMSNTAGMNSMPFSSTSGANRFCSSRYLLRAVL